MNNSASIIDPASHKTDCHVIGIYEGGKLTTSARRLDELSNGYIKTIIKRGDISGKPKQILVLHDVEGISARRVMLVGCGKLKQISDQQFHVLIQTVANNLNSYNIKNAVSYLADIELKNSKRDIYWKIQQGSSVATHCIYKYTHTKSGKNTRPSLQKLVWHVESRSQLAKCSRAAKTGHAIANGQALTRELGNLPGNICTPTYLANQAKKLGAQYKMKVSVLGQKEMAKLKMGSLLSVAKGSRQAPKLIVVEYKGGKKTDKPVVLIGKGITFDSGGISIKPGAAMDEMKYDMCGAATVLGTLRTLGELKPSINVVGIIPSCENMPDGQASKPGDVVTSMSGQTIEILNTDAEGRLILCDAITYSEKFKPKTVIDIATLTGACIIALGHQTTAILGNDQKLVDKILAAGEKCYDRGWQLPLFDEYQEQLKSNFADMANIGGRSAGTITAACFLSRFAKKLKWAHLDIAGVAWESGSNKGATGRPVSMLVNFLLGESGKSAK